MPPLGLGISWLFSRLPRRGSYTRIFAEQADTKDLPDDVFDQTDVKGELLYDFARQLQLEPVAHWRLPTQQRTGLQELAAVAMTVRHLAKDRKAHPLVGRRPGGALCRREGPLGVAVLECGAAAFHAACHSLWPAFAGGLGTYRGEPSGRLHEAPRGASGSPAATRRQGGAAQVRFREARGPPSGARGRHQPCGPASA